MDERTTEFDLGELIGGNVDSIEAKLSELSDGDLKALHDMESKGKKRSTLMDAIHREQKAREPETPDPATIDDRDAKVFSVADVEKLTGEHEAAVMQRLTDGMAELGYPPEGGPEDADAVDKVLMALRGVQEDRDELAKLADEEDQAMNNPHPARKRAPMALAEKHENAALVAATGGSSVSFVDEDGVPVLPGMTFNAGDYRLAGHRAVLNKDVTFPIAMSRVRIAAAFLIDADGNASGKAELVVPFEVGGGKQAKLPAGTLSFA